MLVFSRKHHPTLPNAPLCAGDSHALNKRDHYKYLGVNFSSDLTWSYHINTICKKTRKLIGLLYRNFYQFSNPSTLWNYTNLWFVLIWSMPGNMGPSSWERHQVDRGCTEVCSESLYKIMDLKLWVSSQLLPRTYLNQQKKGPKALFCLLFNIMTGRVVYPNKPFERTIAHYPNRHANATQLSVPFARTNNFKNSYFPSTTALWNSLNFDTSCINSLTSFKHALFKELEPPDSWLLTPVFLNNSCYCLCLCIPQ